MGATSCRLGDVIATKHDDTDVCRACGACCAYSAEWPRFALEADADLARIPRAFVDDERSRMRCEGNRCAALVGEVGVATACAAWRRGGSVLRHARERARSQLRSMAAVSDVQ